MSFLAKIPRLAWELIGIIVLVISLSFLKTCYDKRIIENAKAKAAVDSGTAHIEVARDTLRIRDSVVVRDVNRYHDVARGVIASHPGDTSVSNLVQSCNQVIVSCEDARRAAQVVIDSQDVQIKRLSKMKQATPPRLSFFGEGGYSFGNKDIIARGGMELRIVGPVSVVGAVEGRPKDAKADAMVTLRYTFR